ncbi:macrolide 2'-phosphotransferase [Paeniglutamicibacter kerguelensis]|uniref:Macrolide phosphotransferase n=1 Tax=Paeniglutamicibacter kerguelensis TaxID=254788 RepID=A0ABS4XAY7_9MICC|nr:macrolide 2'-phosphotransferase [Paeniglutamicibacter kerguelensis]MBP2384849.1 macrolide phosphotransferase [Paeniglutamicibacter kerguelensis]
MDTTQILALASDHGLALEPASLRINEAGLDYQVVFATSTADQRWVLRIPRRPDVSVKIKEEATILDFVKPRVMFNVPDWRIHSDALIAYPLLPGEPGLTLDTETGEPIWNFDRENPAYCVELGQLIAQLHAIDPETARAAGIPVHHASDVRSSWLNDLAKVRGAFSIPNVLLERWTAWIREDSYWPTFTVFTHGELYPAHLLLQSGVKICSVLDWTTARVTDPAVEFMYHYMLASPEAFAMTVRAYEAAGGPHRPNLIGQCEALIAAGPVTYACYALTTGEPEHRVSAQKLLDSAASEDRSG